MANWITFTVYPKEEVTGTLAVTNTRIKLEPGEVKTGILLNYTDPDSKAKKITFKNLDPDHAVANTDYKMSANLDGSGTDLIADLSVDFTYSADVTTVDLENTGSTRGYVYLQVRGVGIRVFDTVSKVFKDQTSIDAYGVKKLKIDAPYQDDPVIGDVFAPIVLRTRKDEVTETPWIEYFTDSDFRRQVFFRMQTGKRFQIKETVGGIDGDYSVTGISWSLIENLEDVGAIIKSKIYVKRAQYDLFEFIKWDITPLDSGVGWDE